MTIELEPLREAGLYIDERDTKILDCISTHQINRLLYWGDLKLWDLNNDPIVEGYYKTEKLRNITLVSSLSKIVRKYPNVVVSIPYGYRRVINKIILNELSKKYSVNGINEETIVEQTETFTVKHVVRTTYQFISHPKIKNEMTMKELYQEYLDLPMSTKELSSFIDTDNKSDMLFRFTPPGTCYNVGFFFNGSIMSIKVIESDDLKAEDIIKMSDWANKEFADIVESAKVCKEIEETIENDDPETETSYECRI